jgi:molecular chaperone DnaK
LVNGAEKALEDAGDKADDNLKKPVQDALSDLKKSLESDDIEDIKQKSASLSQVMMKLGEAAYKDLPDDNNQEASEDNTKKDDADVVDADFEEVDNEKKDK